MDGNTYYTWRTKEYTHTDTPNDWFWAVGIITLVICIIAIMFKNYLFAVLMLVGVGIIMYTKIRQPKDVEIKITDQYIQIGEDKKYYQDIASFWIEVIKDENKTPQLLIALKRKLTPLIIIKLPTELRAEDVRQNLLKHLEERQMTEGGIYELMEKLGF